MMDTDEHEWIVFEGKEATESDSKNWDYIITGSPGLERFDQIVPKSRAEAAEQHVRELENINSGKQRAIKHLSEAVKRLERERWNERQRTETKLTTAEEALMQIAALQRDNPAPGYEHTPLVSVECKRIARASLSKIKGVDSA